MHNRLSKVLFLFLGLLVGLMASIAIIVFAVNARINHLSQSLGMSAAVVDEGAEQNVESADATAPSVTPTEDIADPEIYKLLSAADSAIQSNNPQTAIDLILPNIEQWPSEQDKATGYQLLAVAEFNSGRPQRAIPYAKKMVEYAPDAFSLLLLAQAYDFSGDLKNALATYQQVLALDPTDSRVDYEFVRQRVVTLSTTLGTPIP